MEAENGKTDYNLYALHGKERKRGRGDFTQYALESPKIGMVITIAKHH
jgi:hypothetical protein